MRRDLTTSVIAVLALTAVLGVAYPLIITGISQVAFPGNANGSKIERSGQVIGSKLLAQPFMRGNSPDPRYFQPRPSQTGYNPAATAFSNRGPNQASAKVFYEDRLKAYLARERPFNPGLTANQVPSTPSRRRPRASIPTSRRPTRASRRAAWQRSAISHSPASWPSSTSRPTAGSSACSASRA